MIICQCYDIRVEAPHGPIFTARTVGEAERVWNEMVKRDQVMSEYTEDFVLRRIGDQDEEGEIQGLAPAPVVVGRDWLAERANQELQSRVLDMRNQDELAETSEMRVDQGELEKMRRKVADAERGR